MNAPRVNAESPAPGRDPWTLAALADFGRVEALIDRGQGSMHGFLLRYLQVKKWDADSALQMFRDMLGRARALAEGEATTPGEPRLVHRIWLTCDKAPYAPPRVYLDKMIADARAARELGWKTHFWVSDSFCSSEAARYVAGADAGVAVIPAGERLREGQPWETLFDTFCRDRKFPFAADLLRMRVLAEFGGLYADLGARFRRMGDLEELAKRFDYLFIFWETGFFQNSLMLMPAGSPIARVYMEIANDPYSLPQELFFPLDGIEEGMAFSGLTVTALTLLSNPQSMRICPLSANGALIEWSSERSWYDRGADGRGKFGNAYVPEAPASFLRKTSFAPGRCHPIFLP